MKTLNFTLLKKIRPLLMVFFSLLLTDIVIGQITQRGTFTTSTSTNINLTINKPTGVVLGDVMIANIAKENNGTTNPSLAGWTLLGGGAINGGDIRGTVLYKVATGSEPSSYTFALGSNTNDAVGSIIAFYGVDVSGATPFDVIGTMGLSTTNGGTATAPGITTTSANSAVIMFAQQTDNKSFSNWSATNPTSLTELYDIEYDGDDDLAIGAAWAIRALPGATGNGTVSLEDTNDRWGAILVALKAAPVLPPAQPLPIGCDGKFFVSYTPTGGSTTKMDSLGFIGSTVNDYLFPTNNTNTFNGIGISPIDGFIYGVSSTGSLVKVGRTPNPVPPNFHIVQDLGAISPVPSASVWAACFDANGDFYYTFGTNFRKISAANLNGSRVSTALPALNGSGDNAPVTGTFLIDIAISPITGKMYGVSLGTGSTSSEYRLYEVNIATGALTRLGASGNNTTGQYPHPGNNFVAALFFSENGNLYGYRQDGQFLLMDLAAPQNSANAGTGKAYSAADGCSCSFGSVFHTLASQPAICPTQPTPNPTWNITVSVTNQSSAQQTGLTYTLVIPSIRFSFNETAAAIQTKLFNLGLLPNNTPGAHVTISTVAPAGASNNKLVVTSFRTGAAGSTVPFTLQLIVSTPGGPDESIPLQSTITGLSALLGSNDESDNPNTPLIPNDPTIVEMCLQSTLPVKLISFTGSYKNDETSLNWIVEDQVNFSHYDIERSADGNNYSNVGSKTKQGSSTSRESYNFRDNLSSVNGNTFFYRLKIVDIDGKFKYSNVILIRKDQQAITGINFSPNPVMQGETAVVRFMSNSTASVELRVVDMSGRVVLRQQNFVAEGTNSITINNLDRLQTGMYVLQVNNANTIQITRFNIVR